MADKEQVIKGLDRIIGLIETDSKDIPKDEKKKMVSETLDYFNNYVSPGWLKYRKSVSSDSEGGAVLEWEDGGAYVYGLNGEKFIDCLGGFGI
ncbi:MAG: putrescine aminotransferase, partial [Eubacterium sp.]|nr:putrescine aminotransferase [Eubacterium sp.]